MLGSILLTILFLFLNAVFASAEIAVISFHEAKLERLKESNKRAEKLYKLTQQPAKFLATIQVAITLAGFLNSAFAADNFSAPLAQWLAHFFPTLNTSMIASISVVLVTLILSYFSIVFGELVPKRMAMVNSEKLALSLANLLYGVSIVAAPIVWLLTVSTNAVLSLLHVDRDQAQEQVSEEEIRMMLVQGSKQGNIEDNETLLIENVFDFNDTTLDEICTHRKQVTSLNSRDDLSTWRSIIDASRFTYYPVYKNNMDDIVGVLNTKTFFRNTIHSKQEAMDLSVEKPWFVSEKEKASQLFAKMKELRKYFCIVIDEYGGMSGIITIHDLLEAIVGDIYEEEDLSNGDIVQINPTTYRISGRADLDDVQRVLHKDLPVDEMDTFNGWIQSLVGKIPTEGEPFTCQYENIKIHVNGVEHHCVTDALVCIVE